MLNLDDIENAQNDELRDCTNNMSKYHYRVAEKQNIVGNTFRSLITRNDLLVSLRKSDEYIITK